MKKFFKELKENKRLQKITIASTSCVLALAIMLSCLTVFLVGRNKNQVPTEKNEVTLSDNTQEITNKNDDTQTTQPTETASDTETTVDSTKAEETTANTSGKKPQEQSKPQAQTSSKPQSKPAQSQAQTKPQATTTQPAPTEPEKKYVTKADERAIADRVIYYINKFRAEEGRAPAQKLPKLTLVCEYRSRQLVTNFAHDTDDMREANNYYKYGEYVDTTKIPGMEGEKPHYTGAGGGGEAIVAVPCDFITVDELAKLMAGSFRSSKGHWNYVGSVRAPYNYIGVGITIHKTEAGSSYAECCVQVTDICKYG